MESKCNNIFCEGFDEKIDNNCKFYEEINCCRDNLSPIDALKILKNYCTKTECAKCKIYEHCDTLEFKNFNDLEF